MADDYVPVTVCAERMKRNDERFARDKDRLDKYESMQLKMLEIVGTLSEISRRHDKTLEKHQEDIAGATSRITVLEGAPVVISSDINRQEQQIDSLSARVTELEQRPVKFLDKFSGGIIAALATALVGVVIAALTRGVF